MRKPLVVVIVAASALLLAGGVVATTAGAEESSGLSGFSVPGLTRPKGDGAPGKDAGYSGHGGRDRAPGPAGHPAQQPLPAQRPVPEPVRRPAQVPAQRPVAEPAKQLAKQPVKQPAARPGGQVAGPAKAPAAVAPAQRPGGTQRRAPSLLSSARERVTAVDVSSSPGAPIQRQLLALVNRSRKQAGCGVFSVDPRLIEAANEHAADMARRRYFDHNSPSGAGAGDRVRGAGYRWARFGENIARGAGSAYDVYRGWMRSPLHRRNIMDCRLRQMGIGLALAGDGTPYWVQDFATPLR